MTTVKYNKRTWLNSIKSDSTGSLVLFDGLVTDIDTGMEHIQMYLELSDCSKKVRLHKTCDDSIMDYINKMKLLNNEITKYIEHLNKKYNAKQKKQNECSY